jgi:hypothetical protein
MAQRIRPAFFVDFDNIFAGLVDLDRSAAVNLADLGTRPAHHPPPHLGSPPPRATP